ncbi:MAG: hypothetical protein IPK82_04055 [Polyangiaceae bacterium]|nr:hypothetical protein [Polyangiaceae bacterium]
MRTRLLNAVPKPACSIKVFLAALPLTAALGVLLFIPTGCNAIGCFEAAEAGGTCPPQEEALVYFGDPLCGGVVESVNSGPTLKNGTEEEGPLCCYSVSNQEEDYSGCPDF